MSNLINEEIIPKEKPIKPESTEKGFQLSPNKSFITKLQENINLKFIFFILFCNNFVLNNSILNKETPLKNESLHDSGIFNLSQRQDSTYKFYRKL